MLDDILLDDDDADDAVPIIEEVDGEPRREYLARPVYASPPAIAVTSRLVAGRYVLSRETDRIPMSLDEARQLREVLDQVIALLERLGA